MSVQPQGVPVRLRALALPVEHGSWGFLLEPIVLGLLLCPTPAGAWLALATLLARAAHGVSRRRALLKPKQLGWQELGFGGLAVLLLALGYALGV